MSLAKVPRKYLSPSTSYQSKGTELLPPEHGAKPERILKKKIDKEKGKEREMTTSWNTPQDTGHGWRQSVVTKRALDAIGAEKMGIPRKSELTSLS